MASKSLIDIALKLSKQLGANTNKFLGSRSNISFLGKGPKDDLLFQADVNTEALGAFPLNKLLPQIESSMGYLTGGKLNDLQANKLIANMEKIKEFNFPTQTANIIDLGTGTRNLTEEGLGALRQTRKTDDDFRIIKEEVEDTMPLTRNTPLNENELKRLRDVEPFKGPNRELTVEDYKNLQTPMKGSNEIDALETMTKNRAGEEFITGFVDDVYRNSGVTSSVDVPKKRAAAREFLFTMLKKETDLLPQGGTLESVISPTDYKYIMEGGGGALGDPLVLVKKYFGDTIVKRLPLNSDKEVIDTFVENVRFTKDRSGFPNDDPRFNPDDLPEFKHGGLAKILEV